MIVAETPRTAPDAPPLTLLARIGGVPVIDLIVFRFIETIRNDPRLADRFAAVDVAGLMSSQATFFAETFGGRMSRDVTPPLVEVDGEEFLRVVVHLHDALASLELSDSLTDQLFLAVMARVLTSN
jgi:truncated hemoglobin YjbI